MPLRVGYPTDLRGPLLNVRVPLNHGLRDRHQVFYYLAIVDFLAGLVGEPSTQDTQPDCSIVLGMDRMTAAWDALKDLKVDLNRPLFCLCPGSANSEAKRWPPDYFARLADLIVAGMDGVVAFVGSADERRLVQDIQGQMRYGSANLAGAVDLVTAMGVMGLSRMVISNDTGARIWLWPHRPRC